MSVTETGRNEANYSRLAKAGSSSVTANSVAAKSTPPPLLLCQITVQAEILQRLALTPSDSHFL